MGADLKAYPSLALGAQEVVPLDAAAAFTVFPNGGSRVTPYTIAAILDEKGKIIQRGKPEVRPVISPQAAYLTLDLMRGVVNHGTAGSLRAHGIGGDLAGKTGTTNDKRDAWFIGFRPNLLALVWVGYDDMTETTMTGAQGAVPIWEDFMRSIGESDSDLRFERPEGITFEMVDPSTGGLSTGGCPDSVEEMFIEDRVPGDCPEHSGGVFKKFWRRLFSGGKERHADAEPPKGEEQHANTPERQIE
jgi:penicillin-binding protein 1B